MEKIKIEFFEPEGTKPEHMQQNHSVHLGIARVLLFQGPRQ